MIREPPRNLAEFEELSWSDKARVKREFPAAYWFFIGQIRKKRGLEQNYDE